MPNASSIPSSLRPSGLLLPTAAFLRRFSPEFALHIRSALTLLAALLLAGAGGGAAQAQARESGAFRSVAIESHPKGWGYAHKTVTPDGVVAGAHLSGGPNAVRVHESKDRLTRKDMRSLKELVAALRKAPAQAGAGAPQQENEGYFSVIIELDDGRSMSAHTGGNRKFESGEMQAVWDLVHKYRAGAW